MKKIFRNSSRLKKTLAIAMLSTVAFTSCQNSDNDIYEEDPIVRIEKAKLEMKNHLVNESENGWIVTFRPDGGKKMGQFTAWFDFKEDYSVGIKTDFIQSDLKVETSEFNFVMLRTFALSFPVGNKIHEFTQGYLRDENGFILDDKGEKQLYNNRSDIEFMFNKYLDNGDVETIGYLSSQKVVFKKATTEDVAFKLQDHWNIYNRLETLTRVTLVQNGVSKSLDMMSNLKMRSAYIGKITTNANGSKSISETLTDSGIVTFGVNADLEVELVPALELENGMKIDKLSWIGSGFYGEAGDGNSILIR